MTYFDDQEHFTENLRGEGSSEASAQENKQKENVSNISALYSLLLLLPWSYHLLDGNEADGRR